MTDDTRGLPTCTCINRIPAFGRFFHGDGSRHVIQFCDNCSGRISNETVSQDRVRDAGYRIHELPIVLDYRGEGPECEVTGCTSTNTQRHHWAPRHKFGDDASLWPTSHLCREKHHPEWHLIMTPEMTPRRATHDDRKGPPPSPNTLDL